MRPSWLLRLQVAVLCVGCVGLASPVGRAQQVSTDAGRVLAEARQALGGDAVLGTIRSLVITGSRAPRPQDCPGRVQVAFEAPDKFVQLAWHGDASAEGDCQPPPRTVTSEWTREGAGRGQPNLATKWLLPLFASSFTTYPLSFTHGGRQKIAGSASDVIDARGPDGFVLRLFVNAKTHLPAMLTWMAPAPPYFNYKMTSPGRLVEYQMSIDGYKRKDGLNWPHSFRVHNADWRGVVEDIWGLTFSINPTIDPSTFRLPK